MTPFDHSRFDWYPNSHGGPALVLNSSGHPRPPLAVPLSTFLVHYAGAGYSWVDPGDTAAELRAVELNHARPNNKPNEYNSASDSESSTWEYAGPFLAAHAGPFNVSDWGHLVVLGLEPLDDALAEKLIAGIRRARAQCVSAGYITADHAVLPHSARRSTSCPGPLHLNRHYWAAITAPLTEQETEETVMMVNYVRHPRHAAVYRQWSNGTKTWLPTPGALNVCRFFDYREIVVMPDDDWMRAAGPIVGPVPSGVDGFGVPV